MFVFLYALFYYFKRSNMSGLLQSLEFFGYTLLTCYVFFLMLGTVSFFASLSFVRYIYMNLKINWYEFFMHIIGNKYLFKKIYFFCILFKWDTYFQVKNSSSFLIFERKH